VTIPPLAASQIKKLAPFNLRRRKRRSCLADFSTSADEWLRYLANQVQLAAS
jgi:hypothetical protein